jgi:hypothetical protein
MSNSLLVVQKNENEKLKEKLGASNFVSKFLGILFALAVEQSKFKILISCK